jgi:hypothetical protein
MAEFQNLCGIRLGRRDAKITVNLARKLNDGETVTFRLWLADPSRNDNLVAVASGALGKDGQSLDLAVQDAKAGLSIAYTTSGFAKLRLVWQETVSELTKGTAQLSIVGSTYVFPRMEFMLRPPPPPPPIPAPTPQDVSWIIGNDRLRSVSDSSPDSLQQ